MKNIKSVLFPASPLRKLALYLAILSIIFLMGIRLAEPYLTFHPMGFDINENWQLPKNAEEVWLTTADNVQLNAWFFHSAKPEAIGTVMFSHGNSGNLTHVRGVGEDLSQRGFDVLIYDYRGYGISKGHLSEETQLYADGDAAYNYLTTQRHVAPEKLAIYGWSLGTTVSIDLAARKPCAALLLEAPLSSASDMASAMLPVFPRALHGILKNEFNSVQKISNVKVPVSIFHGDSDEMIPTEQGRKVFAAANEPKKMIIVSGGRHWLGELKDHVEDVTGFLRTQLQAKSAAGAVNNHI